ncbi:MAG: hypothetical protein CVT48_02955, partial [Thermoplasmata archaeon HGW-Thermoplasmata-1]
MKKAIALAAMLAMVVSALSGCVGTDREDNEETILKIKPGAWAAFGEKEPELPEIAEQVLGTVPAWLANDLRNRFGELCFSEILLEGSSAPCMMDATGDGMDDIIAGTGDGTLRLFRNVGTAEKPVFGEPESPFPYIDVVDFAAPFPIDVEHDGDVDLVIGNSRGKIILFGNEGFEAGIVRFRERQDFFVVEEEGKTKDIDVGSYSVPVMFDMDGDGDEDIIVGAGDGTLHYFPNTGSAASPVWAEDRDSVNELGLYERVSLFHGIDVGERAAPCFYTALADGEHHLALLIYNSTGGSTVYIYDEEGHREIDASALPPDIYDSHWTDGDYIGGRIGVWPPERAAMIPKVCDFDCDGLEDMLMGGSGGKIHLVSDISVRHAPIHYADSLSDYAVWSDMLFESKPVGGFGYDLVNGGVRNHTAMQYLDCDYVEAYSELILSAEENHVDEVAFVIAHTASNVLRAMIDGPYDKGGIDYGAEVLLDNVRELYEATELLPYARLVEKKDKTTLSMLGRDGSWSEMDAEMYYWYVVHPRCRFEAPCYYNGGFWRNYLLHDDQYGASLYDYVAEANDFYDAILRAHNWTRLFFEWGEESSDKLPQEPYDANYGSCGEWSIFGVALGRTLLIPTRLANDWGEDHVWNEFYADGEWHHWDINGELPNAIDHPRIYEDNWGKTVSTIWSIRGDDLPYAIPEKYTDTASIKVKVVDNDEDMTPLAGACVVALSEWAVDVGYDSVPWITFWNFTNEKGECGFCLGENNYTFIVSASGCGIASVELRDDNGHNGG